MKVQSTLVFTNCHVWLADCFVENCNNEMEIYRMDQISHSLLTALTHIAFSRTQNVLFSLIVSITLLAMRELICNVSGNVSLVYLYVLLNRFWKSKRISFIKIYRKLIVCLKIFSWSCRTCLVYHTSLPKKRRWCYCFFRTLLTHFA